VPIPGGIGAGLVPIPGGIGAGLVPIPGGIGAGLVPIPGGMGAGLVPIPGGIGAGLVPIATKIGDEPVLTPATLLRIVTLVNTTNTAKSIATLRLFTAFLQKGKMTSGGKAYATTWYMSIGKYTFTYSDILS